MNIFTEQKIVLISPPKTGTTAVGFHARSPTPHDPSLSWNRNTIPDEFADWDAYLVVRHPITRALSLYAWWLRMETKTHPSYSLDYFIEKELFGDYWFFSQSIFDRYGHLPVKGIVPQESLRSSLWSIGIKIDLRRVNATCSPSPYRLSAQQRDAILQWGRSDIEHYGYDPDEFSEGLGDRQRIKTTMLRCPFCKQVPEVSSTHDDMYQVYCKETDCHRFINVQFCFFRESAIEHWNESVLKILGATP